MLKSGDRSNGALKLLFGIAACLMSPLAPIATAHAQTATPPTREELQIGQRPEARSASSSLSLEGDIERGPCPFDEPSFAQMQVNFSSVTFANLPGIDANALDAAWTDKADRDLPVATLCQVRDRAATILHQMGFLAAV